MAIIGTVRMCALILMMHQFFSVDLFLFSRTVLARDGSVIVAVTNERVVSGCPSGRVLS